MIFNRCHRRGSEVTYYDVDGAVLGYANVSTWDDGMGGTGTNTGYSDADYNWLGGSWSDSYGSGSNTVEVLTAGADGVEIDLDGNADTAEITIDAGVSYRVESGGFKPAGSDTNENEFTFYYASGGDSDGEFLGGKDTFDFGAQVNIYSE